ncbi:nucleotidyltransferase family protein [Cellulomonas pakistanensis]|uniref:Nucleotidyltransferase n=1 Tax=Cellulomonas pakistanensis TaxID=992287 RepID=A0A919U682_9CELL|nr:nucleotidyltransferase domain-containing protein [Cellulomonas pakistanensis]GIG35772.1 nucleotidyltransferase [Cellulomonas pakistanensis]
MRRDLPRDALARHHDAVLRVLADHGVVAAGVFGSVARGEDGAESDLDLIVHFGPDARRDLAALTAAPESPTGVRVDVVDDEMVLERAGRTGVGGRIRAETVPL